MLAVNLDILQHTALIPISVYITLEVICVYHSDFPNYSEIHEILTRFMAYPHNSGEVKALELLTTVLKGIASDKEE